MNTFLDTLNNHRKQQSLKHYFHKVDIKEIYVEQLIKRVQNSPNPALEIQDIKESFFWTSNEGIEDEFKKALKKLNI